MGCGECQERSLAASDTSSQYLLLGSFPWTPAGARAQDGDPGDNPRGPPGGTGQQKGNSGCYGGSMNPSHPAQTILS